MRWLLTVLVLLGGVSQAAQVALREGQSGRLGQKTVSLLKVQDWRCGPTENCVATVTAQVRVQEGASVRTVVVQLPQPKAQPWSGLGVVALTSRSVTLTDQPSGSSRSGHRLTLGRGQSGLLGRRQVTVQGWNTLRCPAESLCLFPQWSSVYVNVQQGRQRTWLALDYPPPPAWPGLTLLSATTGDHPTLTFSDQQP